MKTETRPAPESLSQSLFLQAVEETLPEEHKKSFADLLKSGVFAGGILDGDWSRTFDVLQTGNGFAIGALTAFAFRAIFYFTLKDWEQPTRLNVRMNTIFSLSLGILVGTIRWAGQNPADAQMKAQQLQHSLTSVFQQVAPFFEHITNILNKAASMVQ